MSESNRNIFTGKQKAKIALEVIKEQISMDLSPITDSGRCRFLSRCTNYF
jgi:hypothetical protein